MPQTEEKLIDFEAIRLKLASPEQIRSWSYGEVTKPETINYRTQKPEKDGLFCERIFGPTKDWECYCGKYKRIRYKGIICDKCGVEVTKSVVRRERMGHIELAAPVTHIWFLRGVPSKIGLILNLSVQTLEKVVYFANFIVTNVDENLRAEVLKQIDVEFKAKKKEYQAEFERRISEINGRYSQLLAKAKNEEEKRKFQEEKEKELSENAKIYENNIKSLTDTAELARREVRSLHKYQILTEAQYQDLSLKYGHIFEAGIGAEAIRKLLEEIDLAQLISQLENELPKASRDQRRKIMRRLRLAKSFKRNNIRPEWMVLTVIPVIPPDLRPMVPLDGGRFASSDLNDLYRRVINRNNRLKRLLELNAPEVICRNEKRMLQEAVDALIDNSARRTKTVTASTGGRRQLKSLADILKGKQGRFRQNLLGKRVDYSGRSVIVVGPHLRLHQCGIPKIMALELFKPFVISKLIKREIVHNVRSANRFIEAQRDEVWDILEEITKNSHVLLNRAPTLHRLGIQAFQPILIEGKAIQIHPLVCPPFNADFDGDQMAVHLPLTEEARQESAEVMLSSKNILKPATGEPIVTPSQDIVLGCYYLTQMKEVKDENKLKIFASEAEALNALETRVIDIQTPIKVRLKPQKPELTLTCVGRIIFNQILPAELRFVNEVMDKKKIKGLITLSLRKLGNKKTVELLDELKKISLKYLTQAGISWGMDDLTVSPQKQELIKKAEKEIEEIQQHYEAGLLTDDERHLRVVEVWSRVKDEIMSLGKKTLDKYGPVYTMVESGARGSWPQITQMIGMKGLVTNPAGETIELPVKGSFKEGFSVLEYFISTHGARKGLTDTALRTANAGYLTRRLVDVAQEVIVREEDCKDEEGIEITEEESKEMGTSLIDRIWGRVVLEDIKNPKTGKIIVKKNQLVDDNIAEALKKIDLKKVRIRSVLSCKAKRGVCVKCYGYDLGYNKLVELGTAVGIIAAQSIGEPGTQLTMRTFHTGGVAGVDITQGLPRVEELFEARPVKKPAIMADVAGQISIKKEGRQRFIRIHYISEEVKEYPLPSDKEFRLRVKSGQKVKKDDVLFETKKEKVVSEIKGEVEVQDKVLKVKGEKEGIKEYPVPAGFAIWVKDGQMVERGDQLTEGHLDLHTLYRYKGKEAVQKYIVKEIQYIYSSQGQKLNDKHIEIIVRQMFSRYYVRDPGDSDLLPGEIINYAQLLEAQEQVKAKKGKMPVVDQLLLGITKASLSTESFLAAASFQETARVLIDAAVTGKVDYLRGLKENVIIGKLIPVGTGFREQNSS